MAEWNPLTRKTAAALEITKTPDEIERQREIERIIEAKVAQALRVLECRKKSS